MDDHNIIILKIIMIIMTMQFIGDKLRGGAGKDNKMRALNVGETNEMGGLKQQRKREHSTLKGGEGKKGGGEYSNVGCSKVSAWVWG